jgi:hypothetical protein
MSTVTISWDVVSQSFPTGTIAGGFRVTVSGGPAGFVPMTLDSSGSPAVFLNVPVEAQTDPDYVATVQRVDSLGAALGAAATTTFSVVSPPPAVIDVPGTVTAVVS